MNYYSKIGFIKVKTPNRLLKQILKMKKEMWDQRITIINDLLESNPYTRDKLKTYDTEEMISWLRRVMTLRLIYWKQFKLLGYCNNGEFEGFKTVEFQNSCDQNYEYDDYPITIPFFKTRIDMVKDLSKEEVLKRRNRDPKDVIDDEGYVEYERQTYLYKVIYNDLDLESFIYPCDNTTIFTRFDICANENNHNFRELASHILQNIE